MTKVTYRQWMTQVEERIENITGLNFDLLPDWLSHDCYSDGHSVDEGVTTCLEQIGFREFEEPALVDEA
jgi:hypothetical protein